MRRERDYEDALMEKVFIDNDIAMLICTNRQLNSLYYAYEKIVNLSFKYCLEETFDALIKGDVEIVKIDGVCTFKIIETNYGKTIQMTPDKDFLDLLNQPKEVQDA